MNMCQRGTNLNKFEHPSMVPISTSWYSEMKTPNSYLPPYSFCLIILDQEISNKSMDKQSTSVNIEFGKAKFSIADYSEKSQAHILKNLLYTIVHTWYK